MKILVTGSAGFIGSHLVDFLLAEGHDVIGIDNFFRGKPENLPSSPNFRNYELDLSEKNNVLVDILNDEKPSMVFHYAAINGTKYFYDKPNFVFNQNNKITFNLLEAIDESSTKPKIMYASSSEVYGHNPTIPTRETDFIQLNSEAIRDSYASSKAFGDFSVKLYCQTKNMDYLIFRIFNTYGPRMVNTEYGQVIPEFIRKAKHDKTFEIIGDGQNTRSFCFVDDHVKMVCDLAFSPNSGTFNIGVSDEITISHLAKIVHKIVGRNFEPQYTEPRPHDTIRRCPDITKVLEVIKKVDFTTIEDGIRKMI